MSVVQRLRSKYLTYAQVLGDLEFQIHVLTEKRNAVRAQMQSLDASTPELRELESEMLKNLILATK